MADREALLRQRRRMRRMYLHLIAYVTGVVGLFVSDYLTPGAVWFHWPAMVWGAAMGVHYLYCKSLQVAGDEEWADSRTKLIRLKSYDLGHIRAIDPSSRNVDGQAPR